MHGGQGARKVINFDPYKWKMHFNPLMIVESDFSSQKTHDAVKEIINALFGSYFAMVGEVRPDTDHFIGQRIPVDMGCFNGGS